MSGARRDRILLVIALALATACSSSSGVQPAPAPAPAPRAGAPPAAAVPPSPGAPIPTPTRAGAFVYQPTGGAAYAYERRDSLALQLPGGAMQVQQSTRTAFLTVSVVPAAALAPAPAAYAVTIRLDSLRQDMGGTLPQDSLLVAQGTRWTGSLTPDGRLTGLAPDRTTGVGDQIGAGLSTLFPALPPGGVVDGATWSDTTQRTLRADAFDAVERAVTTYHATKTGGNALAIASSTTFERTGERADTAQPMQMASHGARQGSYRFGAPGLVLDAMGADSAEMTISIPAVGQSVPVSQRANWRFTLRQ